MNREPDEQSLLTSVSRLREAGPELSAALLSGPVELRRRILSRLVTELTYLKEDRNIEVTLVLPYPDVPLRLAAPDDLSAPRGPEERVPDSQSHTVPGVGHLQNPHGLRVALSCWFVSRGPNRVHNVVNGEGRGRPANCSG